MAEAIFSDLSLIPVLDRFGITLGVGDLTVDEVCSRHDVDTRFFLAVANTFLNENYFPDETDVAFPVEKVLRYLELTDRYYAEVQLPNIGRHFRSLLDRSPGLSNLSMLSRFFEETRSELLASVEADREKYFPIVRSIRVGECDSEPVSAASLSPSDLPEALSRRSVADKVDDLAAFFVMHLRGQYDSNLCFAVLSAVSQLAKDISQNNRIREKILCPLVERLIVNG